MLFILPTIDHIFPDTKMEIENKFFFYNIRRIFIIRHESLLKKSPIIIMSEFQNMELKIYNPCQIKFLCPLLQLDNLASPRPTPPIYFGSFWSQSNQILLLVY